MSKLFNKFIITLVCIISLILSGQPAVMATEGGIPVMSDESSQEITLDKTESHVKDIDIEPINTDKVKKSVVPDTRQEGKKLIGLFIKTMLLVAFCAVVLYVILFFIKRYYGSAFVPSDEEYEDAEML